MHMRTSFPISGLKFGLALLLAGLAHSSLASGQLSQDEVKALVTDKTVFAWHERGKYKYTNYFAPDGSVKQQTEKGKKNSGTWKVESDGGLCVAWTGAIDTVCGPLVTVGNGTYKRMRSNPRNLMGGLIHFTTFERFENGNSQGL